MRFFVLSALIFFPVLLQAQEETPVAPTHEVKQELLKIDIEIDGVIESKTMVDVSVDTESWTDLKIEKILEQGARVAKGDELVAFDKEKLELSIKEKIYEMELAELNLKTLELELANLDKTLKLDLDMAERSMKHAQEDFDYFNSVERPMSEKSAENSLKSSQWSLENSQEEFQQLEKMYKEDELTEESEAIVLKRSQRDVEQSEFWLERAQQSTKQTLEVSLPRTAESKRDELARKKLEHEKTLITLPMNLQKQKVNVEKTQFAIAKQAEVIKELRADLEKMLVKSPASGLLYHGKCVRGKWSGTGGSGTRELIVDDSVTANSTFLTIVDPNNVFIRCDLDEDKLGMLEPKMKGRANLVAFPDRKANVSVESVNMIPYAAGKFDCRFSIDQEASLMPGLSCKIKIRTYENEKALTLPSASVFSDNDEDYYVFKVAEGSEAKKVTVEIGKKSGDKTEITSGLVVGDKVLQTKPE